MAIIYHLVKQPDWDAARPAGEHRAESLATEGFIHCSGDKAQMLAVANARFGGQDDLLALEVDTARLSSPVRYERSRSGGIYPHIYGPLNNEAVRRARRLLADPEGRFVGLED